MNPKIAKKASIALCGIVLFYALMLTNESSASFLIGLVEDTLELLVQIPLWLYVLGFIVLPVFGFPLNAFYLTITTVTGSLWVALPLAYLCVLGNMFLAYVLTKSALQRPLEGLIEKRDTKCPGLIRMPSGSLSWRFGSRPPHGFCKTPFWPWLAKSLTHYLLISLPIQAIIATGIITTGASLLQGDFMMAIYLFVIFCLVLFALKRFFKHRVVAITDRPVDDRLKQSEAPRRCD